MAIIPSKSIKRKMVNESWTDQVDSVIFENDLFTLGPYKMTSLPPYQDKIEEQIHCVPKGAAKKYGIHIRYDYETLDPKEIKDKEEFKCRYRPETVRVTWQTLGLDAHQIWFVSSSMHWMVHLSSAKELKNTWKHANNK